MQKYSTSSDNRSEIQANIPSLQEQAKIMAQISKEETINLLSMPIVPKVEDAIYIEDTPTQALKKLLNLSECSFKERLTYTKHLAELMSLFDSDGIQQIGNILQLIIRDADEIKKALIAQLPQICEFLEKKTPTDHTNIKKFIVPCVQSLLECPSREIKEDAGTEVVRIARYLTEEELGTQFLVKVINMAHDDLNEENKTVAVKLLGSLSETFGQSLTESFIAFEILSLGEDVKQTVRKEAVLKLPTIGKVVSQNFFKTRLFPFFLRKCDEKTWQTRKSCVDVIIDISNLSIMSQRETELVNKMLLFLNDSFRQVKIAAYKKLGMFISTLAGCDRINEKIFEHYIKMTDPEIRDLEADKEMLIVCAQNFPAVLYTYGASKWPQMNKLFQQLFKNSDKRIKRPLACSLHEIAKILGSEMADKELSGVMDLILKDPNDDIKYGAIANLWQFLEVFQMDRRENLLDNFFLIIWKEQKKWRIRELIAKQLNYLVKIFSPETVFRIIMPISIKLCQDKVYFVRKQAAKRIYAFLQAFEGTGNELFQMCLVESIKGLAESQVFNLRQTFIQMCGPLMNLESGIFELSFLELFKKNSQDKVKNVRLLVAKVIKKHIENNGRLSNNQIILQIFQNLRQDKFIRNCLNLKLPTPNLKQQENKNTYQETPQDTTPQNIEKNFYDGQLQMKTDDTLIQYNEVKETENTKIQEQKQQDDFQEKKQEVLHDIQKQIQNENQLEQIPQQKDNEVPEIVEKEETQVISPEIINI